MAKRSGSRLPPRARAKRPAPRAPESPSRRPGSFRAFEAILGKQGPNYCVDVPMEVSKGLSPWSRAQRITVEGTVNGVEMRATLIPAGIGRHRLFLQSGTRNAASIAAGDRLSLRLRPIAPDDVRPPRDVALALRKSEGATATFASLPASHRRELLRHVDAARTPAHRKQRVAEIIDHTLGKGAAPKRRTGVAERALCVCPHCGNEFVNRNQYHSCKRHKIDDAFAGKPSFVRELYDRLAAMIGAMGPVKVIPYRDKVSFMVRVRFAGAVPRKNWLDVAFWTTRRIDHRRFHKIETLKPDVHLHLLRVTDASQLDAELTSWLRESYAVGCQEHLK